MNLRNWVIVGMMAVLSPLIMASQCDRVAAVTCPTPKTYSEAFLAEAEKELRIIAPQAPHIVQMLGDYDVTLSAIRVCLKAKKKKG